MMRKTDPRVIRTRQMLREALIATILEKGYDAANIQDITDRAGLRRATFYLHYRDKEELLLSVMRETLEELMQKMGGGSRDFLNVETLRAEELIIFQDAQARADVYRAVLSGRGAAGITRGISDFLAARIRDTYLTERSEAEMTTSNDLPVPIEVLANYMAAVKLNMISWWLDKGMPYTPEQMAEMYTRLVLEGAGGMLESAAQ